MKRQKRFAIAFFALAAAGAASPAQAGLLDFLFGGGNQRQQQYYAPAYAPQTAPGGVIVDSAAKKAADAARRAAAEHNAETAARNKELIARLAEVSKEHGPRAAFMLDPTLRAGDVVVMPSGLEVFEGQREKTHGANQFRPLRESSLRKRSDLALLQQISGLNETEKAAPTAGELRPLTIAGPKKKKVAKRKEAPPQAAAPKTADAGFFATR